MLRIDPGPGRLAGVLFALLVAACGSPATVSGPSGSPTSTAPTATTSACALVEPRQLPSGAAPGSPEAPARGTFRWGSGRDALTLEMGTSGIEDWTYWVDPPDLDEDHPQRVEVRGVDAVVYLVGDDGVGSIAIIWQQDDCPYTLWLADGTTIREAADYAVRF